MEGKNSAKTGVLHEILVGYFLNNESHMLQCGNAILDHELIQSEISEQRYSAIRDRAKFVAEELKKYLNQDIVNVFWTPKPGNVFEITGRGNSLREDASDIYLRLDDQSFVGVSLKVSENKKRSTTTLRSSSQGLLDQLLKVNTISIIWNGMLDFQNKYPQFIGMQTKHARKYLLDQDDIREEERMLKKKLIVDVANVYTSKLNLLPPHYVAKFVHDELLRANDTGFRHIRSVAKGLDDCFHKITNPAEEFAPILEKNLRAEKGNSDAIWFKDGDKNYCGLQIRGSIGGIATGCYLKMTVKAF